MTDGKFWAGKGIERDVFVVPCSWQDYEILYIIMLFIPSNNFFCLCLITSHASCGCKNACYLAEDSNNLFILSEKCLLFRLDNVCRDIIEAYNPSNIFANFFWSKSIMWSNMPQLKLGNIWWYAPSDIYQFSNFMSNMIKVFIQNSNQYRRLSSCY